MPTASSGSSFPVFVIEQANLDDVEVQQVLREVQDVRLQQLDPLFDRHLRHFVGRQVGQLDAGLMNGRQLLLLQHFVGHVANRDDQMLRRLAGVDHRRRVHRIVAVVEHRSVELLGRPVASAVWNGQKSGPRISGLPSTS